MTERAALPRAVYTVSETCRILRPGMTPRKVHYWLHTGLLGAPLREERRGLATLLSFDQLTQVRVIQRLRDELGFSLPKVRRGLEWLLHELVNPNWSALTFFRTGAGEIGVRSASGTEFAIGGQYVLDVIPDLNAFLDSMRSSWESGVISIEGFPHLVSDVAVMSGAPVVRGTRIETAFVAHLASVLDWDSLMRAFPTIGRSALDEALQFEDVRVAA